MLSRPGTYHALLASCILLACGDDAESGSRDAGVDAGRWDPSLGRDDDDDAGEAGRPDAADGPAARDAGPVDAESPAAPDAGAACPLACEHGGTCAGSGPSASCSCPPGFRGALCGDDIDECAASPSPCPNPGSYPCHNFPGGYSCLGQTADWPVPRRAFVNNDYASEGLIVDRDAGTILDEVTGLMWQRSVPSPDDANQQAAAQACAQLELGGYDDWRLPSLIEFGTLNTTPRLPSYPAALFEGVLYNVWTSRVADGRGVFVTADPYPYGGSPVTETVPSVGHLCVRTDRVVVEGLPESRFDSSAAGLVTDRRTNLTWQRTPSTTQVSHADARAYCEGLELGAYSDFRLPSYAELLSTCDEEGEPPHCGGGGALVGPNEPLVAWFWTDTVHTRTEAPFVVDYVYVRWMFEATQTSGYVRCVRSAG